MHDTTPAAEAQLRALYGARSPAERLRMATAMFGTVTRVTLAGLRHEEPRREGVELRLALLERLHGDDLTASIRAAVAAYYRAGSDRPPTGARASNPVAGALE